MDTAGKNFRQCGQCCRSPSGLAGGIFWKIRRRSAPVLQTGLRADGQGRAASAGSGLQNLRRDPLRMAPLKGESLLLVAQIPAGCGGRGELLSVPK